MLRITVNKSASSAKKYYSEKYYSEGKSREHYYSEKDQSIGVWNGKAAEMLGLRGDINKEDFSSLCDNLIPGRNEKLTDRTNSERRVGYDFTFNASKSVSLAYTFGSEENKKQILQAFQQSVNEAMSEIENGMQARIRQKGQNDNRETKNIIYGEFTHFTSRPVDGISDPHLHAHCFVFNTTFEGKENKWKAGEFGQINKDAPYYEAVFHSLFADKLKNLGYEIERGKTGFEIKGFERETIQKFSRRTTEIENLAIEKNITDKKTKGELGAKTRESKRKAILDADQAKEWEQRLSKDERAIIAGLKHAKHAKTTDIQKREIADKAIEYSLEHNLERKSVATEKEILTSAIKSTIGDVPKQYIKTALDCSEDILTSKEKGETLITSKATLMEESNLFARAYRSKGCFKAIHEHYEPKPPNLTDEQKFAIQSALTTSDGITIIAGKAGTGKTTLMKEVQNGIKEAGKKIFAFAPSAEASRVIQRKEGFENAETLAALFNNKVLQEKIKNSVVWVDEAGMVSNKDMNRVLAIAEKQNARVILTGDTKQHSSVERGDALRLLQKEAGIVPIEITKIQRQKSQLYKEAVSALSKGDTERGFKKLDRMSAIHEVGSGEVRAQVAANDYVRSAFGKGKVAKEVLVIAPTHAEGEQITGQIRKQLKESKLIGAEEKEFRTFKNLQLTAAEKLKPENYQKGNWVVFHQNIKGFKAGSKFEIISKDKNGVQIKVGNDKEQVLPIEKSAYFNLFEAKRTNLAKGDKIRITGNGKSLEGKNLFNGIMYHVTGFDRQGNIKLSNGSSLSRDYGHFNLGYVVTSHSSQGKTVDKVIISQSSMSFRAASKEQFYVSVSRGKTGVAIYTDDKADLLRAISRSNERQSATELLKRNQTLTKAIEINRRRFAQTIREKTIEIINKLKAMNNGLQRNIVAKEAVRSR